jgi:phosphoadenosine phosphosulfate reductase
MTDALLQLLEPQSLAERLATFRRNVSGRIVFTTSLGLEDQVITHCIAQDKLDIEIITLDTGRLFAQTYDVWARTQQRYGICIKAVVPQHAALEGLLDAQGPNGFYDGLNERKACCRVRKIEPLGRALAGASGWIAGLRADQSQTRGDAALVSFDGARDLLKLNPLIDWSREQALSFALAHDIPLNTLHGEGFASIGCAPCTRALKPGEPERAGRWWWEDTQKECGLHMGADGRLTRNTALESHAS